MKIQINEIFSFEKDKDTYGWQLHELKDGVSSKTKLQIKTEYTTYHATLKQVCKNVIDRSLGKCDSLNEIITMLENAENILTVKVEELVK
jgi:hypothetical protein